MSAQAPSTDRDAGPSPAHLPRGYYWERTRRGALPLVVGALGLVGLGVGQLIPLRHQAESNLRVRSLEALGGAGLSGVNVDFTGQDGVLRGTVSSAADVDRALEIVRGLEGVRVARSELSFPGSGDGSSSTGATGATPSTEPSPAATASVSTPAPAVSAEASASASASPGVAATASATASPAATVAPTPTPAPSPATSPAPSASTAPPAAVQQKLAAFPAIGFEFGSSRLTPAGRATVARMAAVLKASPNLKIQVNGYTDDSGDWDVNLALSKGRAEAVRQALVANGIPAARVTSRGWSEERPKVPNTSAKNRAINRRVEVVVS